MKKKPGYELFQENVQCSWKPWIVWLKMPRWSDCLKKTNSANPVRFSGTFVRVF